MPNRLYQFIALAVLVVAPLVVHVLNGMLPGARQVASTPQDAAPPPGPADRAPPPPPLPASPPLPSMADAGAPGPAALSTDPLVDTAPSLDVQGIAPAIGGGAELSSDAEIHSDAFAAAQQLAQSPAGRRA